MKKTLILIAMIWAAACSAQSNIGCTGDIILETGSKTQYASPVIFVKGQFDVRQSQWLVTLGLAYGVISVNTPIKAEYGIRFTKAEINAYTGTGTGDTEKVQNALEQAVVDYLEALNPSATIVIN